MNEQERPSVSVRQRAATINRNLLEEQRTNHKRGSIPPGKAPWRSAGINTTLPRRPLTISSHLPQRKLIDQTRRDSWRAPIPSNNLPRRPEPGIRKRELADNSTEYLPLSKHRRLMTRPERHHIPEARHERSSSISSISSVSTHHPILHDDSLASTYATYLQWRLTTIEADESSDRKRMEEENQLWAMDGSLWELRVKYGNDNPAIDEIGDRLRQFASGYEQLEETIAGTGAMKSSDDLVQNLQSILDEIHTFARDLGGVASTERGALENCRRIMNEVAHVEAENQSLSAIL